MYILENKQDGSYFGAKSFYVKSEFETQAAAKAAKTRYAKKHADIFDADIHEVVAYEDYVEPMITRTKVLPGPKSRRFNWLSERLPPPPSWSITVCPVFCATEATAS